MVKFFGKIGFGKSVDRGNGIWEDEITERTFFGDVVRDSRRFISAEKVNADINVTNSISIVADAYALENTFAIRYVEWAGVLYTVSDFEIQSPRLILRLGGVYNGPRPSGSSGTA
jgi:hypothetical protein